MSAPANIASIEANYNLQREVERLRAENADLRKAAYGQSAAVQRGLAACALEMAPWFGDEDQVPGPGPCTAARIAGALKGGQSLADHFFQPRIVGIPHTIEGIVTALRCETSFDAAMGSLATSLLLRQAASAAVLGPAHEKVARQVPLDEADREQIMARAQTLHERLVTVLCGAPWMQTWWKKRRFEDSFGALESVVMYHFDTVVRESR